MDLLNYITELPIDSREDFAKKCGTSLAYMKQIAYGNKNCGAALAISIDRESGGKVLLEELCPEPEWEYVLTKKKIQRKK